MGRRVGISSISTSNNRINIKFNNYSITKDRIIYDGDFVPNVYPKRDIVKKSYAEERKIRDFWERCLF